ncbi:packaged DNA stabilization gp4 family protein [Cronobacter malonaticus]
MNLTTKGDLALAALRKLGVASNATLTDVEPQSLEDAVNDLEMMMAEWSGNESGKVIDVGYIFSPDDEPVIPGDAHGLARNALNAVILNLSCRIAPDYEIEPMAKLITGARYGKEQLYRASAIKRARDGYGIYPSRMPVGSGNRWANLNNINYYPGREKIADPTTPTDEGNG